MIRNEWRFPFTAETLGAAAAAKRSFHADRLKFWEDAKEKVMVEVRESGIEVSESEARGSHSNYSAGMGPQVMVRNDLQRRLTECHGKIIEHSGKVREYAGWVEVLNGNPKAQLDLHADDYLFFFGK